nr:SMP-30/gluconolactonase/LRE family protein [Mesorhizobium sp.]
MNSHTLTRLRYTYLPDHLIGEILSKRWIDNAIPVLTLALIIAVFGSVIGNFFTLGSIGNISQQVAELGLLTLALTIVMLSGGIDLSIGSIFGLAVLATLICMNALGLSVGVALLAALATGMLCGLINGLLIGYLRLRAFLTTLVMLIILRSVYEIVFLNFATRIVSGMPQSKLWDYLAFGKIYGIPAALFITLAIALVLHVILSRARHGWHITAVGGARRSAYNAGINVRRTICAAYVWSGGLAALAGFIYAARLGSAGADTGAGLEITALTAAVLGGISLGGGRGSVAKALIGTISVAALSSGLVRLGVPGPMNSLILGTVLILAVFVDVRWMKNKQKILNTVYMSPAYVVMPKAAETAVGSGSPYAVNDKLREVDAIGLGILEGPEDCVLDRDDNLYCGTRHGDVMKFHGPDHKTWELFAHVGGHPLGIQMDRDNNIVTCVGGMGLYMITPQREVVKLTDETNRSAFSIIDDSQLKIADDLDITDDGRVYFSEATIRYNIANWPMDALESRGNGRIVCYDMNTKKTHTELKNLVFPNGVCIAQDQQSFYFAESWGCRLSRYWFDGPKKGTLQVVIDNLPGYPDNINRSSDGHYWFTLMGMRTPSLDLALRMPGFRRRMARQIAVDEWLFPNINNGCVLKFNEKGEILDALWDLGGQNHPMITSIREHKGNLYLGGISNNRIGRYKIPGADPNWCALDARWGKS